jgi:hypothetical protein
MSDSQKTFDVGAALHIPLALGTTLTRKASSEVEKLQVGEKISAVKDHETVTKIAGFSDYLWTLLGVVLIFHGAQFKNLFLCTQVITEFCLARMKSSVLDLYSDFTTAKEKMSADAPDESNADAKAEAKPDNKHAEKRALKKDGDKPSDKQREEDAAEAKKLLKVVDTDKVSAAVFEVCIAAMVCHMVMEGGVVKLIVVTFALVKACKDKINGVLRFSGFEDMRAWTDLLISAALYSFFGTLALLMPSMAFALTLASSGAQLVTDNALRIGEAKGKIPTGVSAKEFAKSVPGLALLGGLTLFGTMWQFWAIMAGSDMAFYFKIVYLPAYIAENLIGFF